MHINMTLAGLIKYERCEYWLYNCPFTNSTGGTSVLMPKIFEAIEKLIVRTRLCEPLLQWTTRRLRVLLRRFPQCRRLLPESRPCWMSPRLSTGSRHRSRRRLCHCPQWACEVWIYLRVRDYSPSATGKLSLLQQYWELYPFGLGQCCYLLLGIRVLSSSIPLFPAHGE